MQRFFVFDVVVVAVAAITTIAIVERATAATSRLK